MKDLTHWTLKFLFPFVASNLHDIYDICSRWDAALVYLKLKIWSHTRNGKHLVVARCRSTRFISRICLGLMYKTPCEYGDLKPKHNQICHFPKSPGGCGPNPFKPHLLVCHHRKSQLWRQFCAQWQYCAWFHTVEGRKITIDLLAECRAEWISSDSSCLWFYFAIRTDVLFLHSKVISSFLQKINIYVILCFSLVNVCDGRGSLDRHSGLRPPGGAASHGYVWVFFMVFFLQSLWN